MALAIVRYRVGEDQERSIVKLYNKLMANADIIPAGVLPPLVKPRSIDDVPTLAVTLWSGRLSAYALRRVAVEAVEAVNSIDDVSETTIIGGERRQVRVVLDAARLRGSGLSALQVLGALRAAHVLLPSGSVNENGSETLVETGSFRAAATRSAASSPGVPGPSGYLREVAKIEDGPAEPSSYVLMGLGPGAERVAAGVNRSREYPAVTIAIAKKAGTNASTVAATALRRIEGLRGTVVPKDVELTVTRNYGETAQEKSDELLKTCCSRPSR
jgi:multidrug efflux pump subunit AcrB